MWNSITSVGINASGIPSNINSIKNGSDGVIMYPNPLEGTELSFFFEAAGVHSPKVKIFNISGQLCYQRSIENIGKTISLADLNLSPGVYRVLVYMLDDDVNVLNLLVR